MNENNIVRRKTIIELYNSDSYFLEKAMELKEQGIDIEKLSFEEAIKYVYPEFETDFQKVLIEAIIEYMKKGGEL